MLIVKIKQNFIIWFSIFSKYPMIFIILDCKLSSKFDNKLLLNISTFILMIIINIYKIEINTKI